jgi:hypothetical protein
MGASGKHRPILTLIASRPACLRGTGVDVGDSGGRPLQHRNNRSLRVLWPYHRMVEAGEVEASPVLHPGEVMSQEIRDKRKL